MSFDAALEAVAGARVTLVLGAGDTGKTVLTARLANGLLALGHSVGIVDADLGQSEIGPPGAIGLGVVRGPLGRLAEAEVADLRVIGVTSPVTRLVSTIDATGDLVEQGRAMFQHVLVDTCGLVVGPLGRRLKLGMIVRVAPDVVVALQRAAECEALLHRLEVAAGPRVIRLTPDPGVRRRTRVERRRHREEALRRYLDPPARPAS